MSSFAVRRFPRQGGRGRSLLLALVVVVGLAALLTLFKPAERVIVHTIMEPAQASDTSTPGVFASTAQQRRLAAARLPMEVYARGPSKDAKTIDEVSQLLQDHEKKELKALCGRTLYHSLQTGWVSHETGMWTFVATGDLPLMWIRDSAVQINVLLPRIAKRPALRRVIEGALRAQAFYITQDPYANGYYPEWRDPEPPEHDKGNRDAGRGGWVAVRNYELDSGAYYLNLLWNYYLTPGLYQPERLLAEPLFYDAANLLVNVWIREQWHNESSPYRFHELCCDGMGSPVKYTGMTWSGFRPSDDGNTYGFPIAANMYAVAGLERALELNRQIWQSPEFARKAKKLVADIKSGIRKHGIINLKGKKEEIKEDLSVYAYEVDGMGNSLTDFDDPNIPSLISIPLLGYPHDDKIYRATRERLLSKNNSYYFIGTEFSGMGSPHTSPQMAWALGLFTEVLTATTAEDKAAGLRTLLKLQCGDGLMHESVNVNSLSQCTRKWFEWANAMLVISVESLLGYDCDESAEAFHRAMIKEREAKEGGAKGDNLLLYQPIEASVQWDVKYVSRVADWKGLGHFISRR